jgi:hypothetical protein
MGRYGALHNSGCIYVAVEVAVTLTLMLAIRKGSRGFAPFAGDISGLLAVRWFKHNRVATPASKTATGQPLILHKYGFSSCDLFDHLGPKRKLCVWSNRFPPRACTHHSRHTR